MTRRLLVWLAGGAVLLAVFALVGCVVAATNVGPVKAPGHPGYAAGTACDAPGCHDTYKHKEPYLGPCENCHSLDRWLPAVYSHKDPTFDNGMHPLIGCAMCHTEGKPLPSPACNACHKAPHEGFKACMNCHTTSAWGMRKPLPDDHVSLEGGHSTLTCFQCHTDTKAPAKARTCVNCHGENHGGLRNCQNCHDPARQWNPKPGWSHDPFFRITGQHKKLECGQCHKNGRFAGTPQVCVGCHGKKHGGLSNCAACHTTAGFGQTTFRHSSVFALTGRHAKLACTKCHANNQFARVRGNGSHACTACHGVAHGNQTQCQNCHTTAGFQNAVHPFPLVGVHATISCSGGTKDPNVHCHVGTAFTVAGTHCVDCHASQNPHGSGTTDCQNCHTPAGFGTFTFTHPSSFPLTGGHNGPACVACHPSLHFTPPPGTACVGCHSADSPHGAGTTVCETCHNPIEGWGVFHFTHPATFPLNLNRAHATIGCDTRCHPGLVFSPPPNPDCTTCH